LLIIHYISFLTSRPYFIFYYYFILSVSHCLLIYFFCCVCFILSCSLSIVICACMLCCFCNWPSGCWLGTLINQNWIKLNWIIKYRWSLAVWHCYTKLVTIFRYVITCGFSNQVIVSLFLLPKCWRSQEERSRVLLACSLYRLLCNLFNWDGHGLMTSVTAPVYLLTAAVFPVLTGCVRTRHTCWWYPPELRNVNAGAIWNFVSYVYRLKSTNLLVLVCLSKKPLLSLNSAPGNISNYCCFFYERNNELHCAESFLRSWQFLSYSKNSPLFMEPESSLPFSQQLTTCPYLEPDQSNSNPYLIF
jgi:hypothetical protein